MGRGESKKEINKFNNSQNLKLEFRKENLNNIVPEYKKCYAHKKVKS